jgi:acyl-CoA dehydrogenase
VLLRLTGGPALTISDTKTALTARAARVGAQVAGPFADDVDTRARFPHEAIDALRDDEQLSSLVPPRLGGAGATIAEVADATSALARHCGSTAMIYAMHQAEVACMVRHGTNEFFEGYLRELARRQLLVASATTELGIGGDVRSSACAVERGGGRYHLEKRAPVISYGEYADAILVTARRCADSPPNDQVMVLCAKPGLRLEPMSGWDTLGFRGTCSRGFELTAEGDEAAVIPESFDLINALTNLPVSHILWSHVWLGLAAEATERSRAFVQAKARKQPGVVPSGAIRLAELNARYLEMAALVRGAARRYDEICDDSEALSSMSYVIEMNALKISASTLVVDIVGRALGITGMDGYRQDSPFSMGRLLRDAHGAALMLNNDRLLNNNALILLVDKGAL